MIEDPVESFDRLFAQIDTTAGFGHRQHIELTWRAIREFGEHHAQTIMSDGIRRAAERAHAPKKFHATITYAWVHLVSSSMRASMRTEPADDFDEFVHQHPDLLDKHLLERFYLPSTLAGTTAREQVVPPDLAPLPE